MEILSIGKDTADGRKLLNYRAPKNARQVHVVPTQLTSVSLLTLKMVMSVM